MKKIIYAAVAVAVISLSAFAIISSWKVKGNEASVKFTAGRINGSFSGLKASIVFDKDHPEQVKFSATIDAPSIATGFFLKNSHAKDALGTDRYPTIKFVSTSVNKNGNGYVANGALTMKGITKPAAIHFTFADNKNGGIFRGGFRISPKNFGINRNGTPEVVLVELVVPVVK